MRGVSPLRLSSLFILLSLSCCWLQLSHAAEEGGKQELYARPAGGTVDQRTDEIPTYSAEPVLSKYSDMRSNTKIPTSTVKEETVEKGYTDGHPPTPMTVTATPVSATSGIPGAIPVARSTKEGSARATAARDGADHLVSPSNHTTTIIDEVATSRESPQVLGTNSGASGIPKAVSTAKGEGNDEAVWEEEDRVRRENAEKLLKDAQERLKKESEEKEEEEARMREEEEDRRAREAYDRKKEEAERKARVEAESRKEVERKEREEKERKEKEKEEAELKEREEAERKEREEADRKKKEAERKEREEADRKKKEAERKEKEEIERKAREEADRKKREAERQEREEADHRREEAEKREKEEAERKEREEADRKKREAERKRKEEADGKEKEEAERKDKEEAERKAKEEADREVAERKTREEADRKKREAEETERNEREEFDRRRQQAERKEKEAKLKEEAEREKEIEREGGEVVRNGTDLYEVEHANPRKEAEEEIEGGSQVVKEEEEHDATESPLANSTKADSERGRVQDQQERVEEDQLKDAGGRVDIPAEVTDLNQDVEGVSFGDMVKDTATRAAMVTRELWMLYGEPAKVEVLHATGIDSPLLEVYVASSLLFLSIVWALLKRRSLSLPKADDGVIWRFRASRLERPVCSTAACAPAAAAVNTSSGGINEEQFMQLLQQVQYLAQMANYTTQSLQTFMEESQAKFNSLICDIAVLKQDLDEVDCELLSSSQQVIEHLTCRSLSNLTQEERSSLNEVSDLKKITSPKEDGDDQSVEEKENESPQYANGGVPSLPVGATADRRPHTLADTSISSPVGGVHPPVASGGPVSPVAETMKSSIASPGVHAAFTGPNYSPDATPSPPPAPHHEQQPKTEWDASPSVQIPGGPLSVSAPSNGVHPPTAGPTASVAAPSPQNTSSPAVSSSSAPPQPVPAAAPVAGYDDHKPDTTMQSAEASPLASPPSNGVPAAFAQPARFRPAPKRMPQARRQRPHPVQGATDPFASLMQVTGTAGGPARVQNKAYSGPPPPQ